MLILNAAIRGPVAKEHEITPTRIIESFSAIEATSPPAFAHS
jgi:hypothetical protein